MIFMMAFLLCAVAVFGQNKQEVIRLKNGSTLKGTVVGEVDDSIAVKSTDGSVFFFATSDITERKAEDMPLAKQVEIATATQTNTQPQVVYVKQKKEPGMAGFLSFLVPGVGQFYYGNNHAGWIDLGEAVVSDAMIIGGYLSCGVNAVRYQETGRLMYQSKAETGACICIAGAIWSLINGIWSIVDAVKGTYAVNRENGYAMFNVGGGVSVGARPQLTYEQSEYAMQLPASLSAGMSFRIAF
jgi:TM2 domain.